MERSNYFGLLRDLYHFDHFMGERCQTTRLLRLVFCRPHENCHLTGVICVSAGAFANYLPELLGDFAAYDIVSCQEDDGKATVTVSIHDSSQRETAQVRFVLARKLRGRNAGSWMTASLVRSTI